MKGSYAMLIASLITLALTAAVYQNFQSAPTVEVTGVNAVVKGIKGNTFYVGCTTVSSVPLKVKAQGFFGVSFNFTNTGNATVYVTNVLASTPGFQVSNAYFSQSLPLSIPPSTSRNLYVAVQVDSVPYSGVVNFTVVVSGSP